MIPVLTLWQPWASLVALGVKTIETRSWTTKYRGRLAISAAARSPRDTPDERRIGEYRLVAVGRYGWAMEGPGLPEVRSTPRQEGYGLQLGAIVATCTLVDVVPMMSWSPLTGPATWAAHMIPAPGHPDVERMLLLRAADTAAEALASDGPLPAEIDATPQLPYGDYRPGRFAWLLEDIVPLARPVPFKGGQGLTRKWDPVAA